MASKKQQAEKRVAELREQLNQAAQLYYNEGAPPISDAQYDELYRELQALEAEHPQLVAPDSPTQRVGAPLPKGSRFEEAEHLLPMLSIESLTSEAEVREFDARAKKQLETDDDQPLPWAVEPKFDGVSASLLYEDGLLVRGLSRGDGQKGEVITQNLRTIRNLPLRLQGEGPFPARIEVRGEVLLSRDSFAELQARSETTTDTPFRNARNTVAGSLKLMDPSIVAQRKLDFVCWGVGHIEGVDAERYQDLREVIAGWGFALSENFAVVDEVQGVIAFHDDLEARRESLPYEMDGIVAKLDQIELQRRLGRTARTPRWMLAYKFAPQQATTTVESITAQVGRTGVVTPVANLAPVELAGVTVQRATLHNWGLVEERDVREGDTVDIERAGDVIPAVVKVHADQRDQHSEPTAAPKTCPTCDSDLEAEGAFLYCLNVECPDQLKGRVVHFASRRALDIERLGPKNVDQLMAAGLLRRLEDIFELPQKQQEILDLERWGERSYEKLVEEIEAAKKPELARLLNALGIRHVGEQTAKDLAAELESIDALAEASEERLCEVEGVGTEVAASIRRFFSLPENQRFLEAAKNSGLEPQVPEPREGGDLEGRIFCFTGGLDSMSRDEAKILVEARGARTSSSISKKVTDVVAGQKAGSKIDKAKKLELNVLDEDAFLALIGRTR